eukprot:1235948-Rhodomonas_salina.1
MIVKLGEQYGKWDREGKKMYIDQVCSAMRLRAQYANSATRLCARSATVLTNNKIKRVCGAL